jgi:integrase
MPDPVTTGADRRAVYRLKLYRGWWYAVRTAESGSQRVSLRTQDKALARQRITDLEAGAGERPTDVSGVVAAYLDDKATSADVTRLKDAWKRLAPVFGHLRPDQVTRFNSRSYAAKRREAGVNDNTIRKELATLRAALRWENPQTTAVVELPAAPPPRDRYLTRAEYDKLLAAAEAFHIRGFIILALATAARKEAILSLTWDRVDIGRGIINLGRGTRNKGRAVVPINEKAKTWLAEAARLAVTEYVIEWGNGQVTSIRKGFATACKKAGLKGVTPHVLRHTAAVWMAEAGLPMSEISQYLGHSSTQVTERVYARYSADYLRKAAEVLQ